MPGEGAMLFIESLERFCSRDRFSFPEWQFFLLQGACISGDKTMLVMEFVEGGDLWRNLQRPGSRVGKWHLQGRKVALDIARGLCFLHAHSIV